MFEFVARTSQDAEWSWTNYKKGNEFGNILGTSHQKETEGFSTNFTPSMLNSGYTFISVHSHTYKTDNEFTLIVPQPSGYGFGGKSDYGEGLDSDAYKNLSNIKQQNNLKNNFSMYVYDTKAKQYYLFNNEVKKANIYVNKK